MVDLRQGPIRPKNYQSTILFAALTIFMSACQSIGCLVVVAGAMQLNGYAAEFDRFQRSGTYTLERFHREIELRELAGPLEAGSKFQRGFTAVVTISEGILFVIWLLMAHRNLKQLGRRELHFEPVAALLWWLAPIMNFWMPCRVAAEVWNASNPDVAVDDPVGWRRNRSSYVVIIWWLLLWSTWIIAAWIAPSPPFDPLSAGARYSEYFVWLAVVEVLTIVTNMWQAAWIVGVIRRQSQLYADLKAATDAPT
jgi:hypothetical protein